jgi:putative membrane protein insertion efficiency factor
VQSNGGHKTASDVQGRIGSKASCDVQGETRGLRKIFAPRRVGILMIRGYQVARLGRPSPCRFVPSCSEYAVEALKVHGLARGTWLSMRRLLRCRPGGGFGVDLVPDARGKHSAIKKRELSGESATSVTSKAS